MYWIMDYGLFKLFESVDQNTSWIPLGEWINYFNPLLIMHCHFNICNMSILYSVTCCLFCRRGNTGTNWADDHSYSRQTQAEEKTSWAFEEAPCCPCAPSVGERGGRGGEGKQTWDGHVKTALPGYKSEHQHFNWLWVPPAVQWCRHSREYIWGCLSWTE